MNQPKILDLKGRHLFSVLPETLGEYRGFEELILDDNSLTSLPENIGELINLKRISLYKNKSQAHKLV